MQLCSKILSFVASQITTFLSIFYQRAKFANLSLAPIAKCSQVMKTFLLEILFYNFHFLLIDVFCQMTNSKYMVLESIVVHSHEEAKKECSKRKASLAAVYNRKISREILKIFVQENGKHLISCISSSVFYSLSKTKYTN